MYAMWSKKYMLWYVVELVTDSKTRDALVRRYKKISYKEKEISIFMSTTSTFKLLFLVGRRKSSSSFKKNLIPMFWSVYILTNIKDLSPKLQVTCNRSSLIYS